MNTLRIAFTAALILIGSGSARAQPADNSSTLAPGPDNLLLTAAMTERLDLLVAAITLTDLTATLRDGGPYTIFAPSDEAFRTLPDGAFEDLIQPQNRDELREILLDHLVEGVLVSAEAVTLEDPIPTVGGGYLELGPREAFTVGGATIEQADVSASNGVIHIMDGVLSIRPR